MIWPNDLSAAGLVAYGGVLRHISEEAPRMSRQAEHQNYDRLVGDYLETRMAGEAWARLLRDTLAGAIVGAPAMPEDFD